MTFKVIRMDSLLRECPDVCHRLIDSFKPAVDDADVEQFIKTKAKTHIDESRSMTYLAIDVDNKKLLGYYTLALSLIRIDRSEYKDKLVKKLRASPDIPTKDKRSTGYAAVSYLIGQLGRTSDSYNGFGRELLNDAIYRIYGFSMHMGGKLIRIDCKDELIRYYEKSDFHSIKKYKSSNGPELNTLIHYIITPDYGDIMIDPVIENT